MSTIVDPREDTTIVYLAEGERLEEWLVLEDGTRHLVSVVEL